MVKNHTTFFKPWETIYESNPQQILDRREPVTLVPLLVMQGALDDNVRPGGHVHVEITGDDKPLWQGDLSGADPPRELALDIAGVRRLAILVDFGKDQDVADHLDLCEAQVIK